MAKVLRGKHRGKTVTLNQWSNDWFTVKESNIVYNPVSLEFTDEEKKEITESDSGMMFDLFEWNGNKLKKRADRKPLKPQHLKFIANIEKGMSQTAAYTDAYPDATKETAEVNGSKLLSNTKIKTRLEERKRLAATLAAVDRAQVFGETARIAFADIRDSLDDDGYIDFKKARENGTTALIKKITRNETQHGQNTSIEFYSKQDALKTLGDYLGMKIEPRENPKNIDISEEAIDLLVARGHSREDATKMVHQELPQFESKAVN